MPLPESIAGHRFARPELACEALTHPCARRRKPDGSPLDSERLEFLGDAVINLVLADALHATRPEAGEGELSACRATLASGPTLTRLARNLGLTELIDAGDDPAASARVRGTDSAAENAMEALVGAVYRDAGIEAARALTLSLLGEELMSVKPVDSPKNKLQELVQARSRGANAGALIEYRTVAAEGPVHARRFTVEVRIEGVSHGLGEGASLKLAGEAAARAALAALAGENDPRPPSE